MIRTEASNREEVVAHCEKVRKEAIQRCVVAFSLKKKALKNGDEESAKKFNKKIVDAKKSRSKADSILEGLRA